MRCCERGQALVEFALAGPVFIALVLGIVQLGLGISYWHDLNRIANQGARWATQNTWPGCPTNPRDPCTTTLQDYLRRQAHSSGLRGSIETPVICYPDRRSEIGDPVRVRVGTRFHLAPIVDMLPIRISADATMRLEASPSRITGAVNPMDGCGP